MYCFVCGFVDDWDGLVYFMSAEGCVGDSHWNCRYGHPSIVLLVVDMWMLQGCWWRTKQM